MPNAILSFFTAPHISCWQWNKTFLIKAERCRTHTVDGQRVPEVHRRLICRKVSVSRNLSQKVIPSDAWHQKVIQNFNTWNYYLQVKVDMVKPSTLDGNFVNSAKCWPHFKEEQSTSTRNFEKRNWLQFALWPPKVLRNFLELYP